MTDDSPQLYPAWRDAVQRFIDGGFGPGDTLDYGWLFTAFQIARPGGATMLADAEKAQLAFLGQFKAFEGALLRERQVALANIRGVGYRVVPPQEQTKWAETEGLREIRRGIARLGDRLSNVDLMQLTAEQRKENADALAKWSQMRGMMRTIARADRPSLTDESDH